MSTSVVSDEQLARSLAVYAGMVSRVLADPERWLAVETGSGAPAGRLFGRVAATVRRGALGSVAPGSPEWAGLSVADRDAWWVTRIGAVGGLAAAAPRFAGALADRVPVQAALGASASGLAVCAVAREHGVATATGWVPLLGTVLFDRDLTRVAAAVPDEATSERDLDGPGPDPADPDGAAPEPDGDPRGSRGGGPLVLRSARTLWRLARVLGGVDHLLDHRPRGGFLARSLGRAPVIGVAGGWLDERGAIRRAAGQTARLVG